MEPIQPHPHRRPFRPWKDAPLHVKGVLITVLPLVAVLTPLPALIVTQRTEHAVTRQVHHAAQRAELAATVAWELVRTENALDDPDPGAYPAARSRAADALAAQQDATEETTPLAQYATARLAALDAARTTGQAPGGSITDTAATLDRLLHEEHLHITHQLAVIRGTQQYTLPTLFAALLLGVTGALTSGLLLARSVVRRVNIARENAARIPSGAPLLPHDDARDEIGALIAALHDASLTVARQRERLGRALDGGSILLWEFDTWTGDLSLTVGPTSNSGMLYPYTKAEEWLQDIHPEDRPACLQALDAAVRDHAPCDLEYRVNTPDQGLRWYAMRGHFPKHAEEPHRRMLGVLEDITERKHAEATLAEREAQYETLVATIQEVVFHIDTHGRWTVLNRAWTDLTGQSVEESLGRGALELVHPEDRDACQALMRSLLHDARTECRHVFRLVNQAGEPRDVEVQARATTDKHGNATGIGGTLTDITDRLETSRRLQEQRAFYEHILNSIPVGIAVLDPQGRYQFCNPSAIPNPKDREWIIGRTVGEYSTHKQYDAELRNQRERHYDHVLKDRQFVAWEEQHVTHDDRTIDVYRSLSPIIGADGELEMVIGYGLDITDRKNTERALQAAQAELERRVEERTAALRELNDQLQHDALHDTLTGMPNRALFNERLHHVILRQQRNPNNKFAVLFLDMDRFKVINDSLGHNVGDTLLIAFGQRLARVIRPTDTAARLGGDEFTILLEDLESTEDAVHVAQRVLRTLSVPFHVDEHEIYVGTSIGIVTSDVDDLSPEGVMRDADIAMYRAKAGGRNRYVQFDIGMREQAVTQMRIESELRNAIEREELIVYYQPIVSLATGRLEGFEALVRWQHPTRGFVSPAEFIPLAEETGLIIELDRWVLLEASKQVAAWQRAYPAFSALTLSVNMSTQQFDRPDFLPTIELLMHTAELDASCLNVEITEGLLMERNGQVTENIEGLHARGIALHIDDFGTGYSSLSYLQRFAATTLKIDRSFIARMLESADSQELVRAIISMAHNLNMGVVAEGVETAAQMHALRTLGCEHAQGFLFSRPLDPHTAAALLEQHAPQDHVLYPAS